MESAPSAPLQPSRKTVKALKQLTHPQTITELRGLLGFLHQQREYVEDFDAKLRKVKDHLKQQFGFTGLNRNARASLDALVEELILIGSRPKETFWTPEVAAAQSMTEPLHLRYATPEWQTRVQGGGLSAEEQNIQFRAMFIERAKNYIGTSYDVIDCCGLVRKCVHDLPRFGFKLDQCNQGLMFQSLMDKKHAITDKSKLRPGDLIFYEAEYVDTSKPPKRHNIVHIEILIGPQEETIGSRSAGWYYPSLNGARSNNIDELDVCEGCECCRSFDTPANSDDTTSSSAGADVHSKVESKVKSKLQSTRQPTHTVCEEVGRDGVAIFSSYRGASQRWKLLSDHDTSAMSGRRCYRQCGGIRHYFRNLDAWLLGHHNLPHTEQIRREELARESQWRHEHGIAETKEVIEAEIEVPTAPSAALAQEKETNTAAQPAASSAVRAEVKMDVEEHEQQETVTVTAGGRGIGAGTVTGTGHRAVAAAQQETTTIEASVIQDRVAMKSKERKWDVEAAKARVRGGIK